MTLVPSWQQLANPANAAEANLLQPLFAAAASDADWRRPLIVDSSGGLRLQAEQAAAVFPAVVYERAAVAASASRYDLFSKHCTAMYNHELKLTTEELFTDNFPKNYKFYAYYEVS